MKYLNQNLLFILVSNEQVPVNAGFRGNPTFL